MEKKFPVSVIVTICLAAIILTFLATCFYTTGTINIFDVLQKHSTFKKIEEIDSYVRDNYIKEINEEALQHSMAEGYLTALDDRYGEYYTKDEFLEFAETNEGELVGIGVSVRRSNDGYIEILEVYPNSPADLAGILQGDLIITIDDADVIEVGFEQAVDLLAGEVGTNVNLTVKRNEQTLDFSMTRAQVEIPSVYYCLDGDNGYIKITSFTQTTTEQFNDAVTTLCEQGAKKLIFDLRDNGGGVLDSVCQTLDILLPEGTLATQTTADGKVEILGSSDKEEISLPMAVITNKNTASAAELFVCDLKDYSKAIQVGETTYGKGVMQTTHPLSDGSAIKITTAYYSPAKSPNYDGVGVVPDYEVFLSDSQLTAYRNNTLPISEDPQYQTAVEKLNTEISE